MSRRRDDRKRFDHSPFRSLKGLPVSQEGAAVSPPVVPETTSAGDGDLFAREMQWLDVRPLPGKTAVTPDEAMPQAELQDEAGSDTGQAEFMTALGKLDKVFTDELPEDVLPHRPSPRRMKRLERGELKPSGELDLHGLNRDEALARVRAFLAHASRQGWPLVLIVTGKGLHSAAGPVLREAVERLLGEAHNLVLEWGVAPRRYGGSGALAVFVRPAPPTA